MSNRAEVPGKKTKVLPQPGDLIKKDLRNFLDGGGEYFDEFKERFQRVLDCPRRTLVLFAVIGIGGVWDSASLMPKPIKIWPGAE